MITYFESSSDSQKMTPKVKAICDHMRAAGKNGLENTLQKLESAIEFHTRRRIRFVERPVIFGCTFPQIVPIMRTGELELRYHLQDGNDEKESLAYFISQIAILTVLATAAEETICSLNPDTAMKRFLDENLEYGHLVHEVTTTLTEIIME